MAGCPSQTNSSPYQRKTKPAAPQVGVDDPRVVAKDGELYTQKTIERAEEKLRGSKDPTGLGSGRPDETNGECRLYAPKLPHPQCCQSEYGFDVDTVREACGYDIYLGESLRFSCGYYFHHDKGPRWMRLGFLPDETAKVAAEHHDRKMAEALGDSYTASTPVPGVEGAYWSRHDQYRWAFLPGWNKVRQLSWEDVSCTDEGILEVMAQVVGAREPAKKARRIGLVPAARK